MNNFKKHPYSRGRFWHCLQPCNDSSEGPGPSIICGVRRMTASHNCIPAIFDPYMLFPQSLPWSQFSYHDQIYPSQPIVMVVVWEGYRWKARLGRQCIMTQRSYIFFFSSCKAKSSVQSGKSSALPTWLLAQWDHMIQAFKRWFLKKQLALIDSWTLQTKLPEVTAK